MDYECGDWDGHYNDLGMNYFVLCVSSPCSHYSNMMVLLLSNFTGAQVLTQLELEIN